MYSPRFAIATYLDHGVTYALTGASDKIARKCDPFAFSDVAPECVAFRRLGGRYDTISPSIPRDFASDMIAAFQEADTLREICTLAIGMMAGPEGAPEDPEWCSEWDTPTTEIANPGARKAG